MTTFEVSGDELAHYGIKRRSGRYPWGSGADPNQRSRDFLGFVSELKSQGMTDTEIARALSTDDAPFTTTMLRATRSIARAEKKAADIAQAQSLKDHGYSNTKIGEMMGVNESVVRTLLAPGAETNTEILKTTADMLRKEVGEDGFIDVGIGTEHYVGLARTRMDTALEMLKSEGYEVINVQIDQLGTNQKTNTKVLAPPGTTYRDIVMNKDQIQTIAQSTDDHGRTYEGPLPPLFLDAKRVGVRYAEDGGAEADGVIYVRPGKDDVSLNGATYAQVRIGVNGTHYLKGMAVYKDDLPDGVDLLFNTNKSNTGNKLDAMKSIKTDDPEDPFGAVTYPATRKRLKDGTEVATSAMNVLNTEGDWDKWSKNLASQMLSKQKPTLTKEQLDKTYGRKKEELDEILALTNPAVKKRLLESYADDTDSASVHLKAAAMDRQATRVILPIKEMKDTEIYAPTFKQGERVALVRYPHGGTFEIPELVVNNNVPAAKKLLGNAKDAVGINAKVAERLSGADFDGDTVLVIPNNHGKVKSSSALEGLKNFDPKKEYPAYEGMRKMTSAEKQMEMGKASNLITDMTIKGASTSEIARAVRHSMVVIDAEKHNLNYKLSYERNGIGQLKERYQGGKTSGASTLISQTTSEQRVAKRKQSYKIDPKTGEKIYTYTGEKITRTKTLKDGTVRTIVEDKTTKSTKGAETKNAHDLSSGTAIEKVYADHSNRLKTLANTARKELVSTKSTPYSPSAKSVYSKEVASLDAKLNRALKNAPIERQAQILAGSVVRAKKSANPDMDKDEYKKLQQKEIKKARAKVGAGKDLVDITDREWEAIQAGAISTNKLEKILANTDLDVVKGLATPRQTKLMTGDKVQRANQLLAAGKTQAEVAQILGVSLTTMKNSL